MRRIAFWLSLSMIFVLPWEDSITITAVGSITRLIGFAASGFWLATILSEGRFRRPQLFHLLVLFFVLWNVISLCWTVDQDGTILRIKTYIQLFLWMLFLWELYQDQEDLKAGLQAYILGAFVSIIGIISNYIRGRIISTYELRYSAFSVNAVDLAILLVLGLPIAWYLFFLDKNNNKKSGLTLINFIYMPLAIFSVTLTGSRSALLASVPVAIYIIFSTRTKLSGKIMTLLILGISLFVINFYVPQAVKNRLASVIISIRTEDLGGRVNLWEKAVEVFTEHPLVGSGSGTLSATIGGLAHNTLISVLAETGLVGFTLFLLVLTIVFFQTINLPKGYFGFWLAILATLAIGASSLSWEFRKSTWLFLSFVVIEASLPHVGLISRRAGEKIQMRLTSQPLNSTSQLDSLEL